MELLGFIFFIFLLIMFYRWMKDDTTEDTSFNTISPDELPLTSNNIPQQILEEKFDETVDEFVKGEHGKQFDTNLLLKKGEYLIFDLPQISLCEERSVKLKGVYQGFSVRIMKGVSYRFGGFQGGSEQRVVEIDSGNLTLTNKRMVFSGEKTSKDISLSKINTIQSLVDGISITRSGKQKTEYYVGTDVLEIDMTISPQSGETFQEETVKWKMSGMELKSVIKKLLQE
jgi:hypothetical protein